MKCDENARNKGNKYNKYNRIEDYDTNSARNYINFTLLHIAKRLSQL